MSHVVASLSRRAFAVAVLASIAMAGMPALAVPVEPSSVGSIDRGA